jgi:hypothetical protein
MHSADKLRTTFEKTIEDGKFFIVATRQGKAQEWHLEGGTGSRMSPMLYTRQGASSLAAYIRKRDKSYNKRWPTAEPWDTEIKIMPLEFISLGNPAPEKVGK